MRCRAMGWRGGEQVEAKEGAQGGDRWLHSPPPGWPLGWRTPALVGAGQAVAQLD